MKFDRLLTTADFIPKPDVAHAHQLLLPTQKEIELLTLPVKNRRTVGQGNNGAQLVDLVGDGMGVFKPGYLEDCLEIPESCNHLFLHERGAYLFDRALQLGIVPTTVLRDIDGNGGSLQEFVPGVSLWDFKENHDVKDYLYIACLFDYCIWNKDRKSSHTIVVDNTRQGSRFYAIDNGLSFDEWDEYSITQNLNDRVFGKNPPSGLANKFQNLADDERLREEIFLQASYLMTPEDVTAAFARIDLVASVLRTGRPVYKKDICPYQPSPGGASSWFNNYGALYFPKSK